MQKLKLKPTRFQREHGSPWESCAPFVDNDRAQLIHRPKNVTMYKLLEKRHLAVTFLCGSASSGTDKFTFIDSLNGNKLVCARCEAIAKKLNLPSADELSGMHIHVGKLVPIQTCCGVKE